MGTNSWYGEWIKVKMDNGKTVTCKGPGWINNDELKKLTCK